MDFGKLGFGFLRLPHRDPQDPSDVDLETTKQMVDLFLQRGFQYFDTAYILRYIGKEKFIKILEKHGADRILFASDTPWSGIKEDVDIIRSFGLDKVTEQKIFCDNARALLGI